MTPLLTQNNPSLSHQEILSIRDEFFDRTHCIKLALKDLASAEKSGDQSKTEELIKRYAFLFGGEETSKRQRKTQGVVL